MPVDEVVDILGFDPRFVGSIPTQAACRKKKHHAVNSRMSKPEQLRGADRRKYHVIYKTTCLVTGRYYIGMHSTDNLADGYIGSGKRLWQSIQKHGAAQHVCEILEHLPSRETLRLREAELVNSALLEDKQCMNIALGGTGSWDHCNATLTHEQRFNLGKAAAKRVAELLKDPAFKASMSKAISVGARTFWSSKAATTSKTMLANATSSYWKSNRTSIIETVKAGWTSDKRKLRSEQVAGSRNPAYGKCWVKLDNQTKLISLSEVENYLSLGWVRGR